MKCNCSCCCCCCCSTKGTTFRSDAGIQGWLVSGLGDITLWREGASIALVLRNKTLCLQPGSVLFLCIYLFFLTFAKPSVTFIKNSLGLSKVPDCIIKHHKINKKFQTKCEIKSENSLWRKTLCVCACSCHVIFGGRQCDVHSLNLQLDIFLNASF